MIRVANALVSRLQADNAFVTRRVEEWCKTIPTPAPSSIGSSDEDALKVIDRLHRELSDMNSKNSARGPRWPGHVAQTFEMKLSEMEARVRESDVDPSIENLCCVHRSFLEGSRGKFDEAIKALERSSEILGEYVAGHPEKRWPGYQRDLILNIGRTSLLQRRLGRTKEAVKTSDHMLTEAVDFTSDENLKDFERDQNFCPILSWAYFHCCESHLVSEDFEAVEARELREFVFTTTFGEKHHLKWPIPVLFHILRNDLWKVRYNAFFEEIADRAFVGTTRNPFVRIARHWSVATGRLVPRPFPTAIAALVLVAAIATGAFDIAGDHLQLATAAPPILEQSINDAVEMAAAEGIQYEKAQIDDARDQVSREIDVILEVDSSTEYTKDIETVLAEPYSSLFGEADALSTIVADPLIEAVNDTHESSVGPKAYV